MGSTYVDIFATKGIEYILVITFLVLLIGFWRFLMGGRKPIAAMARAARRITRSWFGLPEGVFHHQGHAWAVPEGGDQVRVGLDDFVGKLASAQKLTVRDRRLGWKRGEAVLDRTSHYAALRV